MSIAENQWCQDKQMCVRNLVDICMSTGGVNLFSYGPGLHPWSMRNTKDETIRTSKTPDCDRSIEEMRPDGSYDPLESCRFGQSCGPADHYRLTNSTFLHWRESILRLDYSIQYILRCGWFLDPEMQEWCRLHSRRCRRHSSSNLARYAGLLVPRCTDAKNELQGLADVLVFVINGTCPAFANGELMHTTLCASEGPSSTKSSDCILLYISCSKGAATTPSPARIASV